MKRLVVGIIAAAFLVSMARTAMAQTKTVSSEMRTETATVEAIDPSTRTVTLKKPDGTIVSVVAGPDIQRFAEVKVGDKVNARYYENLVIRLKRPGEPEVDSLTKGTTGSEQTLPGGTKARQLTITATIAAIDVNVPSITFTGPNGGRYTSKVQDPAALAKVKVGDKVEIVWTEAVLVSLERGQ
jgi:Cu/Ag efflux protein CusF